MQDIFISALPALLDSWAEAFPKATLFNAVPASIASSKRKVSNTPNTIFWLHINDDKSWLANTMALIAKEHVGAKVVVLANMPSQSEAVQVLGLGAMLVIAVLLLPEGLISLATRRPRPQVGGAGHAP